MGENFLIILSGPSGAGKTTLIRGLFKAQGIRENFRRIKTYTTRSPRSPREEDYIFVKRNEFLALKNKGFFLESQNIYGDYYGTPKEDLERALRKNNVILCVDVKGALYLKKLYKRKAVLIFIMPPKFEDIIFRIKRRGREKPQQFKLRVKRAKKEVETSKKFDYIIINHKLGEALRDIKTVLFSQLKRSEYVLRAFRRNFR